MARIPEAELERIKSEVSITRLVEASGIELTKQGKDLSGLCPYHADSSPSLVISPDKNLWNCLGACKEGGSVIDWVMKQERVSFRHAVNLLRAELGATAKPKERPTIAQDAEDRELLSQVVDYYHETLKDSPDALAYLERRGIASREAIDAFKLGYANRTLNYRLKAKGAETQKALRRRLQKLGIFRKSGHEHLNGSFIVPVFNAKGAVVEMYGRKIRSDLRKGTPLHLYLPGPHAGVWNGAALAGSEEIILCESLIDALTFWANGYRNVTAIYGTSGITEDHRALFRSDHLKRILIAFDRDEAGDKAAKHLGEELLKAGLEVYRTNFPKGLDANEYACRLKPSQADALSMVIRKAAWMGQGCAPSEASNEAEEPPKIAPPPKPEPVPPPSSLAAEKQPAVAAPAPIIATPKPPAPTPSGKAELRGDDVHFRFGEREYRVRGLARNQSLGQLRINLMARRADVFHVDTLDLYAARQRGLFIRDAGKELELKDEIIKRDLGRILLELEGLQEEHFRRQKEPTKVIVELSEEERKEALELLQDPKLIERLLADFVSCGIVGEETNKLVGYLAAVSRKLSRPLAVLIQSSSAAGKSSLLEGILDFMPDEELVKYSAMTGQSLFYMNESDLKHKILALVEEEGASRASYALKLLQSEGELTIASTGKDPVTGRLKTDEYHVEGPVALLLTTTAIEIDEELLNRCLILGVDEGREQTKAIHERQRRGRTLEGIQTRRNRDSRVGVHRNAQRLLRPLEVVNPYAESLTFRDDQTRTRRDHEKYLTLIESITLLHQYQREVQRSEDFEYIEVQLSDIAWANTLADEVLGRSLDELPPQTRKLLEIINERVSEIEKTEDLDREHIRFTRRNVRAWTSWPNTTLKRHLQRLEELEYLLIHRGGRGQSFSYELFYQPQQSEGRKLLPGLLGIEDLKKSYDTNRSAPEGDWSTPGPPQVRPWSTSKRTTQSESFRGPQLTGPDFANSSTKVGGEADSSHVEASRNRTAS